MKYCLVCVLLFAGCSSRSEQHRLAAEGAATIKAAAQATLDGADARVTLPAIIKLSDAIADILGHKIQTNKEPIRE